MTPRYLTASAVARSLGIGPRRLRTLLAAGRIAGAYRIEVSTRPYPYCHRDKAHSECLHYACQSDPKGPWIIPADYTLTPGRRGPQPNWRKA